MIFFGIFTTLDEKSLLDTLPLFCAVNAKRLPVLPEDRSDLLFSYAFLVIVIVIVILIF